MDTLVYVEGRKGEGKSTLLRAIVLAHAREGYQFVVLDSTREWAEAEGVEVLDALQFSIEDAAARAIERKCTLVVDEIDRWLNKRTNLDAETTPFPLVRSIIHYGRHLEAALLCAARRPASVHNDVLELADEAFLLYHSGVASCEWIRRLLGSEVEERVRSLRPGQFTRVRF